MQAQHEKIGILFEKYLSGKLDFDEEQDFVKMIESDGELKEEYVRFKNLYSLISILPQENDSRIGNEGYLRFLRRKKHIKNRLLIARSLKYAAAIALLVCMAGILSKNIQMKRDISLAGSNEIFVPAGQRSRILLNDGTVVWLNASSKLVYPSIFGKERKLKLEGEAFFEVAKNPQKPFSVIVGNIVVTAIGTAFNVCNYPDKDIQVALLEGAVKVVAGIPMQEKAIVLQPGQILTSKDKEMRVSTIERYDYFLWKDGIYSFDNESLLSISKKIEHYYNVEIEIKDSIIGEYKYTGKFRQADGADMILNELQKSYSFKIRKNGHVYIIQK